MTSSAELGGALRPARGAMIVVAACVVLGAARPAPGAAAEVSPAAGAATATSGAMAPAGGAVASDAPHSAFETRLVKRIAEMWNVPTRVVQLGWPGTTLPPDVAAEDPPFQLMGRGAGGWFVIVLGDGTRDREALRVRAGVEDTVAVASHALAAETKLGPEDITLAPRILWGLSRNERRGRPAPGWDVRRPIAAGETLAWPSVVSPPLVVGGEPVRLVWERGGVTVSLVGVALNSAGLGEPVRARVMGRPDRVVATAIRPGTAELTGETR